MLNLFIPTHFLAYNSNTRDDIKKIHFESNNCEISELSGEFNDTDFLYNYEQTELSGLFNGTDFLYLFQAVRTSCRKCSNYFYLYLNIRPMRYSAMQISTRKSNRLNDLAYKSEAAYVQAMSSILPFRAVRRKCFYVYLNIRLMRYSAMQIIIIIIHMGRKKIIQNNK